MNCSDVDVDYRRTKIVQIEICGERKPGGFQELCSIHINMTDRYVGNRCSDEIDFGPS